MSNMTLAQEIGDTATLTKYTKPTIHLHEIYYEIVLETDSVIRVLNVLYLNDVIFGVDYIYSTEKELKRALKLIIEDAVTIGFNMYLKDDGILVVVQNNDLIMTRDAFIVRSEGISDANKEK